jgi:hypothetical protein
MASLKSADGLHERASVQVRIGNSFGGKISYQAEQAG